MQEFNENFSDISTRIKQTIDYLNVSVKDFSKELGFARPQSVYDYISGRVKPSYEFFNMFIKSKYSNLISVSWLISGQGEMLDYKQMAVNGFNTKMIEDPSETSNESGELLSFVVDLIKEKAVEFHNQTTTSTEVSASPELTKMRDQFTSVLKNLYFTVKGAQEHQHTSDNRTNNRNEKLKDSFELLTYKEGTEFRLMKNSDRGLVITPLISEAARVMYVDMHTDMDFINEELPKHVVTMERLQIGVYRSFEHPEYIDLNESEVDARYRRIVTGRRIDRLSTEYLRMAEYIFVSKTGIMIAPVASFNVSTGIFTCYDGGTRDVFEYHLKDVVELYAVEVVTQYKW